MVKLLIDRGANVRAIDDTHHTPLHWASNKGTAALLIDAGADVNEVNAKGQTPLDEALANKRTKTAEILREHGGQTGEELNKEGK